MHLAPPTLKEFRSGHSSKLHHLFLRLSLVWKIFRDVAWFLAVLPIFELLERLHQAGYLPFLFRLY